MTNTEETAKIKSFWEWFKENEARIKEILDDDIHPERDALVRAMDNHILGFGLFTWEMGPGNSKPFFLTLSPNGNNELLEISKLIMANAPQLPDWELNYAKPVKEGDLRLKLYDEDFNEHLIDASRWEFVLTPSLGKQVDVAIRAPNMSQLDVETQSEAANLVVSSLLGEECRIHFVRKIYIVKVFNQKHTASVSAFHLKQKFDTL